MKTVILKKCTASLLFLTLLSFTSISFAANEIDKTTIQTTPGTGSAPIQHTDDVTVLWDAVTNSGTTTIIGYAYTWNDDPADVTITTFTNSIYDSESTSYVSGSDTGEIKTGTTLILDSTTIANDDLDKMRYLHLQTHYLDTSTGVDYLSSDVVVGPFNIDNYVSGSIHILDADGNTVDATYETTDTTVNLFLDLPADLKNGGLYLSESSNKRPDVGVDANATTKNYSFSLSSSDTITTAQTKTIYAWFQDNLGNNSTITSASFKLLPLVSIDPPTWTIDLAAIVTKIFDVKNDATTDTYDWMISSNSGTVAQFSGDSTGVNSVTIQGIKKGTFTLTANPTTGGTPLDSGTITVTQSSIQFTLNLVEGFNLVSFPLTKSSDSIQDIIGNQLPGHFIPSRAARLYDYNPTTSTFDQYFYYSNATTTEWRKVSDKVATSFTISPNKGYWLNIPTGSGNQQIVFDGVEPSTHSTISLVTGFNLIGSAYSTNNLIVNSNLTGGTGHFIPSSADRIYFYDPTTTQFTQYYYYSSGGTSEWRKVKESSAATTDSFVAGQGFWMNVKTPLTWNF